MLRWLSDKLGAPFPFPKYYQVRPRSFSPHISWLDVGLGRSRLKTPHMRRSVMDG